MFFKLIIFTGIFIGLAYFVLIKVPKILGPGTQPTKKNEIKKSILEEFTEEEKRSQAARQELLSKADDEEREATRKQAEAETVRKALKN